MTLAFFAAGIPKGQPRPRAFSRGGHARVFDPGTAEGWKACVAVAAQPHRSRFVDAGPLWVSLSFTFPRPKSHSTKKGLRPDAPEFHTAKPDADNLAKAVLDALTQINVWSDDAVIASLEVAKRYGDRPGVFVAIEPLVGEDE